MWTNVMVGFFKSPYLTATSVAVEGEFSQLKNSILRHESRLLSVDRFVVTHLRSLENTMKFVRSEQLFSSMKSDIDSDSEENNCHQVNYTSYESPSHSTEEAVLERSTEATHIVNRAIISSPGNVLSINYSSSSSDDSLNKEESWRGLKSGCCE